MTRRPASWQAEKARTAKALRELPKCAFKGCKNRGMGFVFVETWNGKRMELMSLWYCVLHADAAQREQRASRAAAPRET